MPDFVRKICIRQWEESCERGTGFIFIVLIKKKQPKKSRSGRILFVQQVFDQNGNAIDSGDTTTPAQRINVYMDNGKVDDFYRNLAKGSLRVVKVCD